jgi:hypothetical protein
MFIQLTQKVSDYRRMGHGTLVCTGEIYLNQKQVTNEKLQFVAVPLRVMQMALHQKIKLFFGSAFVPEQIRPTMERTEFVAGKMSYKTRDYWSDIVHVPNENKN